MKILQSVETPAEKMAEELANLWVNESKDAASARIKAMADENKLTYGEVVAIADTTTCMIHGKPWKKGPVLEEPVDEN